MILIAGDQFCQRNMILAVQVNPIQAGGGGTLCPPTGFFPAVPKRFTVD